MTLGQNIQAARKARGLSQEALAEKIGVSRQALGKWEKDTALPGLDNLQALAAELNTGVDALLGTEPSRPDAPAVTLDAMRDLLAARDAEEKRRRRLWGGVGLAAFVILAGLLAGTAYQYERQIEALNRNNQTAQNYYDAQMAELSDKIEKAMRLNGSTVTDWRWQPLDKLHNDIDKSWLPVQVQVTPRTIRDGMTARLTVRCGDETRLYDMTAAPDGSYTADGLIFTVGSSYELSVQWTADGTTTSEALDTVDFTWDITEPAIIMMQAGDYANADFTYRLHRREGKTYLTLGCYVVEVYVEAPQWMTIAKVEAELRPDGEYSDPVAAIKLSTAGGRPVENVKSEESYWTGTFYTAEAEDGWLVDSDDVIPKFVVTVTDTNGNTWESGMVLTKQ